MNVDDKDTFLYLLTCSRRSLGSFLLARLDLHSRIKKELLLRVEEICDRLAYTLAEIRMANLLRDHGEEIIARVSGVRRELLEPKKVLPRRGPAFRLPGRTR